MRALDFGFGLLKNVWSIRPGQKTPLLDILILVAIQKGCVTRKAILSDVPVNEGSFFGSIRSLLRNGFITRKEDGRHHVNYRLTPKGESLIAKLYTVTK